MNKTMLFVILALIWIIGFGLILYYSNYYVAIGVYIMILANRLEGKYWKPFNK